MVGVRRLVTLAAAASFLFCGTAVLGADKGATKPPKKETTKKDTAKKDAEKKIATGRRDIPDWTEVTGKATVEKSRDKGKEKDAAKSKAKDKDKDKDKDKSKTTPAVFEDFTRTPASQGKQPFVIYFYWPEGDTREAKVSKDCGVFEEALAAATQCQKVLEGFGRYKCDAKKLNKVLKQKYCAKVPRLAVFDRDGKAQEGVTLFPQKEEGLAYKLGKLTKDAAKDKEDAKDKGGATKDKGGAAKEKGGAAKEKGDAAKEKGDAAKEKGDADEPKRGTSKR